MKTAIKLEPMDVNTIPFQEASLDIWDKKYRLSAKDGSPIDRSMDDTYKRVARALAEPAPAASTIRAPGASYAVSITSLRPSASPISISTERLPRLQVQK